MWNIPLPHNTGIIVNHCHTPLSSDLPRCETSDDVRGMASGQVRPRPVTSGGEEDIPLLPDLDMASDL